MCVTMVGIHIVSRGHGFAIAGKRGPKFGRLIRDGKLEIRRHDADHGVILTIDGQRFANDGESAVKTLVP
jgi:hypothetical protein